MATGDFKIGTVYIFGPANLEWYFGEEVVLDREARGKPVDIALGERTQFLSFSGKVHKDHVKALALETVRADPILLKDLNGTLITDRYPSGAVFLRSFSFQPTKKPGISPWRDYSFTAHIKADTANHKRCTNYSVPLHVNDFNLTGTSVVPLPIGAYDLSETITPVTRGTPDGNIPTITSATLPTITYMVDEDNLTRGRVTVIRDKKERGLQNGLVWFQTRNDEGSNTGRLDFKYYSGSAWTTVGSISILAKSSSGTSEAFDAVAPTADFCWWGEDKLLETMWLGWPSTSTNAYKIFAHLTLQYGRPYALLTVNNKGKDLAEVRVKVNLDLTNMRYYTRSGSTLDATGGVYGEDSQSGASDTNPVIFLHTAAVGATTTEVGLARAKLADVTHLATDAGNYWSDIAMKFDNLNIKRSKTFPPGVWIFAQYQGNTGVAPATLDDEMLIDMKLDQSIAAVT